MEMPEQEQQAALFAAFKKNRTWQVPTLVAQRPLPGPKAPRDPRLKCTHWALVQFWEPVRAGDKHGKVRQSTGAYARATVRAMHRAGVRLLAGTDAGGPNKVHVFPGFSLADELELLVGCGLTPADALRTATLNPALSFGEEAAAGTVAEGKRADLVLLDADPLAAIGNERRIAGVMAQGRWLPRPALDNLLDGAAESAARKK
jgi:hypothetical protein